ncbi:ribonuclease R [Kiritimatiellota bacterium B12222]|nr:ribonuclease R [Kiritimatiellota bacterium B12222]
MNNQQLKQSILSLIKGPQYRPCKLQGIISQLGLHGSRRKHVRKMLKELEDQGVIIQDSTKRYAVLKNQTQGNERIVKGVLSIHPQGFGFLVLDSESENSDEKLDDLFIPPSKMDTARHGDRVLAKIVPNTGAGNRGGDDLYEGNVLEVIERGSTVCVGVLKHSAGNWQVIPDDARIQGPIRVTGFEGLAPKSGYKAVVILEDRMDPSQLESGKVQEILGKAGDPGVDILSIMRGHDLVSEFPQPVMDEALSFSRAVTDKDIKERRDLREEMIITIDPADARDFDDALSIEEIPGKTGWLRVGIHIADVAHFVKQNGPLDKEALLRGTSAYLVDRVVPMLPEHLTNDLCSLVPHQDRLAHTVVLDLNQHGAVKAVDSFRSVIHSKQRLTYEQAQVLLTGGQVEGVADEVRDKVVALARLARKLRKARIRENALAFEMPEIRCILDEDGHVTGFSKKVAMEAYQLVEECMLMANREVGALLAARFGTAIYRIHEEPNEENFNQMGAQLRQLGIEGVNVTPENMNEIIHREMPEPLRQAVTLTLLKNMNRAIYSPELGDHFGLAFDTYTHFTSPIRRYPDLIAHRLLTALEENKEKPIHDKKLRDLCRHCSERERAAAEAEVETHRVKMFQYYTEKLEKGEKGPYPGTVSSIMFKGVLVELEESGQRGLVPFPAFQDDYYEVNETGTRANGRKTGRVIQLGDKMDVFLDRIELDTRQMDFTV